MANQTIYLEKYLIINKDLSSMDKKKSNESNKMDEENNRQIREK
jgi:hypothetical protein